MNDWALKFWIGKGIQFDPENFLLRSVIHTYLIDHYNPSVKITA